MSFIDLPIKGEIQSYGERPPQRSQEEFQAIVQAALDANGVEQVNWRQYTPHFNDGEPCVFNAYELDAIVHGVEIEDVPGYGDEAVQIMGTKVRKHGYDPDGKWGVVHEDPYVGPDEDRYDALMALLRAIGGGEFDDVLLKLFGDHALVRIIPNDGIYVEFYEHD